MSASLFRSARFTAPVLFVLGALNAWTAQAQSNLGALSSAICLCVCAAGLFGEDLVQRGYRLDRAILVHIGKNPGTPMRPLVEATGRPERVVAERLRKLCEGGFLEVDRSAATDLAVYRMAS